MEKTKTRKPPKTPRTGRNKKNPGSLIIQRSVGLYAYQWQKLDETGNASLTIRKALVMDGYPEKKPTS